MTLERDLKNTSCEDIIRKILKKAGYHGRVAHKKPHISAVNRQKRLDFANEHVNKPPQFWEKVLFSDESKFCIFGIKWRELVWRKQGTALEKENLVPTVKRAKSLCDSKRMFFGSVYSDCQHYGEYTECKISCAPGMTFDPPSSSVYRCTVDGLWNPPTAPTCVMDSFCEQPPNPSNGHVSCQGNVEIIALYGLVESFFKNDEGHNVTVNGDRYRAMITNFFIPELNKHDVQELWFQQDGATCHTARATIDLLKDTLGDRLISRFGPVNWPPRFL
ncbi:uncharacterized protein TNCV_4034891 [Trichonephila clavipes]|nr:uncharacterized protein TNCV_4034891 [Trichonephila clavipes]